jgi:hypothetical protein
MNKIFIIFTLKCFLTFLIIKNIIWLGEVAHPIILAIQEAEIGQIKVQG